MLLPTMLAKDSSTLQVSSVKVHYVYCSGVDCVGGRGVIAKVGLENVPPDG